MLVFIRSWAIQTDSITQYGITWQFNKAYTVGQFENGDYYVIDDGSGGTVVSVTPGFDGTSNGSLVNPAVGRDQDIGDNPGQQGNSTDIYDYDDTLTVEFPYNLRADESLVSVISRYPAFLTIKKNTLCSSVKASANDGRSRKVNIQVLWVIHGIMMGVSVILSGIAVCGALFIKSKSGAFRFHKRLTMIAGLLMGSAVLLALVFVQVYKGIHFTSLHGIAGFSVFIVGLTVFIIPGFMAKTKRPKVWRKIHRVFGAVALAGFTLTAIAGLFQSGSISFPQNPETEEKDDSSWTGRIQTGAEEFVQNTIVTFLWKINGDEIELTLEAPTTGWIAVGFNPEAMMKGADYMVAYVENGEVFVRDDYGTGLTEHLPDIEVGGSSDYTVVSGEEEDGITRVVVKRLLNTGDSRDYPFKKGNRISVIFAYSLTDGFDGYHKQRTGMKIAF